MRSFIVQILFTSRLEIDCSTEKTQGSHHCPGDGGEKNGIWLIKLCRQQIIFASCNVIAISGHPMTRIHAHHVYVCGHLIIQQIHEHLG